MQDMAAAGSAQCDMAHKVRMIARLNGANIQNSWENLEKEIQALEQTGQGLSDCSPLAADLKLLWDVMVTAATLEALLMRDIETLLTIVEDGIIKLGLYRFVNGGQDECLRIRDVLRQKRLELANAINE